MKRQDSLRHSKDSAYLVAKGYIKIIKDTLGMDDSDEEEAMDKLKKDKEDQKKEQPKKDSNDNKIKINTDAILPNEKKKQEIKDSVKP